MSDSFPPSHDPVHDPARDPAQGPEVLSSGGAPLGPEPGARRGRRTALLAGTAVAVAGLVGGGAWAVTSFLGTGAQPAEALPASTLAYASVDLDPSGEQKIEALRTLRELPVFREQVGLEAGDDVRRYLFEQLAPGTGCEGLDYDEDVDPWLGSRAAVAAVPSEQAEGPAAPVLVVQVSDAAAAEQGIAALVEKCVGAAGAADAGGFVASGEWVVLAETEEIAADVVEAAGEGSLAEDADYARWTDEVGDPGVVSMYAAPAAADLLLEELESQGGPVPGGAPGEAPGGTWGSELGPVPGSPFGGGLPEQTRRQLEEFEGAAATVRFDDGAVELAVAVGGGDTAVRAWRSDAGADAVQTLPADTAAALGVGLVDGWARTLLEDLEAGVGDLVEGFLGTSVDDLVAQAEQASGLELPEDAETLLGDSFAIAVGGDLDLEAAERSPDGSDVPIGAKVLGDGDEITRVLDALDEAFGLGAVVGHDADGDTVAVGPSAEYRETLLTDGGLGGSEKFGSVVREADDAAAVLYLDLDADWLEQLAATERDDDVVRNLEPLSALGMSVWAEDDVAHLSVRLDTD